MTSSSMRQRAASPPPRSAPRRPRRRARRTPRHSRRPRSAGRDGCSVKSTSKKTARIGGALMPARPSTARRRRPPPAPDPAAGPPRGRPRRRSRPDQPRQPAVVVDAQTVQLGRQQEAGDAGVGLELPRAASRSCTASTRRSPAAVKPLRRAPRRAHRRSTRSCARRWPPTPRRGSSAARRPGPASRLLKT